MVYTRVRISEARMTLAMRMQAKNVNRRGVVSQAPEQTVFGGKADGGKNCVAEARSSRQTSGSYSDDHPRQKRSVVPRDKSPFSKSTSPLKKGRQEASDSGCRWTEPIFFRCRNLTLQVAAENFEICFVRGGSGLRGSWKYTSVWGGEQSESIDLKEDELVPEEEGKVGPDDAPHLSEFEQQRALQRPVSLMKSLKVFNL